jgi:anti-anti-sigma factor
VDTPPARVALTRREQLPLPGQGAATVLGAAVVALLAASVPLALLTHQLGGGSSLILVIAFVVVVTVVARHQPRNPIGWSMLAASGFLALSADASLYSGDVQAVVIDFTGLEYMNSGGIGLLVTLLVRAQRLKQRLLACGLTEHYKQILELTRLDEAISIYGNEAEALAAAT